MSSFFKSILLLVLLAPLGHNTRLTDLGQFATDAEKMCELLILQHNKHLLR